MSHNFTLSPEDRLLWQQRAPQASYWFRVSDAHPFINGRQPIGTTLPPLPPYTPTYPPVPPAPSFQPHLGNNQLTPSIPGLVHPRPMTPLPCTNPVPIYDVCHHGETGLPSNHENVRHPLPSHESKVYIIYGVTIDDVLR